MVHNLHPPDRFADEDSFCESFMETLTPNILRAEDLIRWEHLKQKSIEMSGNSQIFQNQTEFKSNLRDCVMSHDSKLSFMREILKCFGVTNKLFSAGNYILPQKEENVTDANVDEFCQIISDLGASELKDIAFFDYLLGIGVGLETHRRKSAGAIFENYICNFLYENQESFIGLVEMNEQATIAELDKKFDMVVKTEVYEFLIEINFYTTSGSKPSEMKRSYSDLQTRMNDNQVLVWITDGSGYAIMQKSLKESYKLVPNIYNRQLFENHFIDDVNTFTRSNTP